MTPVRIFISSVQKEFADERAALRDYLRGDALMRRFFEVFLFEDIPAADRRTDDLYLDEVRHCDIYVGLFGSDYGSENAGGVSPTEQEFDLATTEGKYRLIYVRGTDDAARHPKMRALVRRAEGGLIRKRFNTPSELVAGLYAALVGYLEEKQLIRSGPFDAAPCAKAAPGDLDPERMAWFIRTARATRRFPLAPDASPADLLEHLNLLDDGGVTNAAVLLFGKQPQRFLISSEIKCAHFHGTGVAKPIPSYQVYKGTVFDLVDAAVDFVLSKIALSVGTREAGPQAPVRYEIPKEVVAEAIVNAVAHRDYTSNGSVQVMLFSDQPRGPEPGHAPAVPDARETPPGPRVGAGQPAPRGADVPHRLHRADGHGNAGHDPALHRGRAAGAGVCRERTGSRRSSGGLWPPVWLHSQSLWRRESSGFSRTSRSPKRNSRGGSDRKRSQVSSTRSSANSWQIG